MPSEITVKRGDTFPTISDTLLLDGSPFDLTGATVDLHLQSEDDPNATPVTKSAVIDADPTTGQVTLQVDASITSTTVTWLAEWEVTTGGKLITFPTNGFHKINVVPDIA